MNYHYRPYNIIEINDQIKEALQRCSDIVGSTFGPGGHNVTIRHQGSLTTTKDGVTVARYMKFDDPIQNMVSMMAIDAAGKTVKEVGDGTTTSVVMLNAIYQELMDNEEIQNQSVNMFKVSEGIDMAVEDARKALMDIALPIIVGGKIDLERLEQIAIISANNDRAIGRLIAELVSKVGTNGIIEVKDSRDESTYVEKLDGYVFPTVALKHFLPQGKGSVELENPVFILANMKISDYDQLEPIIQKWNIEMKDSEGRHYPLVIIVEDIEGSALSTLIANSQSKRLPILVIQAPSYGGYRHDLMTDIAMITNTRQVFNGTLGYPLHRFGKDLEGFEELEFGVARKLILQKDKAIILRHDSVVRPGIYGELKEWEGRVDWIESQRNEVLDGADGSEPEYSGSRKCIIDIEKLIKGVMVNLQEQLALVEMDGERSFLKDRLSRLDSGVGVFYVGADSEMEKSYKKDLIDDAQRACFSALEDGVVPGGGNALLKASAAVYDLATKTMDIENSYEKVLGISAVYRALSAPFLKICSNLFLDGINVELAVERIRSLAKFNSESGVPNDQKGLNNFYGYNPMKEDYVDLLLCGIIDPAKAPISALKNAASVAKQLLTTSWFLSFESEGETS